MNREDLRFEILALLYHAPGYTANQETVLAALREKGLQPTRAQTRNELAWLSYVDACVVRESGGVDIATLSDTGAEHVEGYRVIPGIRKPRPGETMRDG